MPCLTLHRRLPPPSRWPRSRLALADPGRRRLCPTKSAPPLRPPRHKLLQQAAPSVTYQVTRPDDQALVGAELARPCTPATPSPSAVDSNTGAALDYVAPYFRRGPEPYLARLQVGLPRSSYQRRSEGGTATSGRAWRPSTVPRSARHGANTSVVVRIMETDQRRWDKRVAPGSFHAGRRQPVRLKRSRWLRTELPLTLRRHPL